MRIRTLAYAWLPWKRCRWASVRWFPRGGGAGRRLKRGEQLRIIDPEGGQSGDLLAFSQDGRERLSNGR